LLIYKSLAATETSKVWKGTNKKQKSFQITVADIL